MMPGIDGIETCRRLKADEDTRDIPVIFMTALTSTGDKVKGFEVGGVDYVTKPVRYEEVLARVTTHLRIRELTQNLQAQAVEIRSPKLTHIEHCLLVFGSCFSDEHCPEQSSVLMLRQAQH